MKKDVPASTDSGPAPLGSRAPAEILIVEDSPTQAERLRFILEAHGYTTVSASDGWAAIDAAHQRQPDLVLSDIVMPEMDGYELCRTFKAEPALAGIPFILQTALSGREDVIRAIDAGADSFIAKTSGDEDILGRVQQLLDRARLPKAAKAGDDTLIEVNGHRYHISASRERILDLLLTTYDVTVRQNSELQETRDGLFRLNATLEEQVQARTVMLERSERCFRRTMEHHADGLVILDRGGVIVFANEVAGDILGRPKDRLEGVPFGFAVVAEEAAELEIVNEARETKLVEMRVVGIEWHGLPAHQVVLRDITESRRIEMEVRRKSRDLETMLYVASHDLREPLRGIRNFSRLVLERCEAQLDEKGRDYLARVLRAGARMDQLMADILAVSRAGRVITPSERVRGDELARQALTGLTDRVGATGAKIVFSGQFTDLRVDPTWAVLAIQNLIANALKFTRDGEAPEIEIGPCSRLIDGGMTHGVAVRDRGIGVAAEHAERIFQLFQRAVGRDVEGTGAGLAIVRQIAERHGGTAWMEPREGGGSMFGMTFGRAWSGTAALPGRPERKGNEHDATAS